MNAVRNLFLWIVACFFACAGCGGGGSGSQRVPPSSITSVSVTPATANLETGGSQQFTAQVTGTGDFNASVSWSVNGVAGGNSTLGTITASGQYTAPAAPPSPNNVTITATSVQDSTKSGSSTATIYPAATLTSLTPNIASAGEQITINGQNFSSDDTVVFSGANGTLISIPVFTVSSTQITLAAPFGSTTGPVYVTLNPTQGFTETTNSLPFTRLPNLVVHASTKDLSSGETLQLDWRLLGASTPNTVNWTADSGSVNAQGVFLAPVVSSESYAHVTGCIENTNSCSTVLLRILPFRITPSSPIADIGNTVQLGALQGGSPLTPQWSVLAGGGSITPDGLYTAPTVAAQAGPIPITATADSTTEPTSVAVSGAFPGLVNRVYDYIDFNNPQQPEATFVKSVAVSGNRAYALTIGVENPISPSFEALEVYDITNPDEPVWIDAGEAAANSAPNLFAYGNTLVSLELFYLAVYNITSQVPALSQVIPLNRWPSSWTMNNGVLYVIPSIGVPGPATIPIDTYDVTTGMAVHTHYELPPPASGYGALSGIAGNGNTIYVSWSAIDEENTVTFTIATYDISHSPPSLVSTVGTTTATEYHLAIAGNVLLADSQVYDISNVTPTQVGTVPLVVGAAWGFWGAEGSNMLASGGSPPNGSANFVVVNLSSPANPVVQANVADLGNWDIFNPGSATWVNSGRFYAADGTGGFAVYNVSVNGGPSTETTEPIFIYIYDQVIQQQTLYAAALQGSGAGGLACFDVSTGTPNLLGTLLYPNDSSFALQVSGTNVFLGLADSLKVVDASNPQSPVEIGSVSVPVNALALSGNTLFVGTGDGRLVVFDVSAPASPQQIASVTMPAPSTMRLSGNLLLVAAGSSGLLIFNVSQPTAPALLSQFFPSAGSGGGSPPVWDAVSLGSAVMLAADIAGVVTVDISNPSNPQQIYQQQLPFLNAFPAPHTNAGILPAFSLASQNGLNYVGTTAGILFAFDATVPAVPRLMAVNVVGADDTEIVSVITPGENNLYLAVQGVNVQLDNTVPQNSIELYYPPLALSYATQIGDAVSPKTPTRRSKTGLMSKGQLTGTGPDRYGNVRHLRSKSSERP